MRNREPAIEVSLTGHSRGTGGFCDVSAALVRWEIRTGYRDESGAVAKRHSWDSRASAEVEEIAQKRRRRARE
jgi:hypothetical protein